MGPNITDAKKTEFSLHYDIMVAESHNKIFCIQITENILCMGWHKTMTKVFSWSSDNHICDDFQITSS